LAAGAGVAVGRITAVAVGAGGWVWVGAGRVAVRDSCVGDGVEVAVFVLVGFLVEVGRGVLVSAGVAVEAGTPFRVREGWTVISIVGRWVDCGMEAGALACREGRDASAATIRMAMPITTTLRRVSFMTILLEGKQNRPPAIDANGPKC